MHQRASDPGKEKKQGFHDGGAFFFLPWFGALTLQARNHLSRSPQALLGNLAAFGNPLFFATEDQPLSAEVPIGNETLQSLDPTANCSPPIKTPSDRLRFLSLMSQSFEPQLQDFNLQRQAACFTEALRCGPSKKIRKKNGILPPKVRIKRHVLMMSAVACQGPSKTFASVRVRKTPQGRSRKRRTA